MPSTKITLPADSWVDVTQSAASGTITHYSGNVNIIFVQAANQPVLTPPMANPVADVLDPDSDKVKHFYGLVTEKIWACSLGKNSMVITTDAEV